MRGISFALLLVLLTGCASQQQAESKLSAFMGRNIESAIDELGRPARKSDMQDGTWEYVWKDSPKSSSRASSSVMGVPLSKSFKKSCTRVLVTDEARRVVSYRTSGC